MHGYSGTPLIKKLGIKEGFRLALVNAPRDLPEELQPFKGVAEKIRKPFDFLLLFADSEKKLKKEFPKLARSLAANGMLWIAWPKKSSGVPTDLSFESVQRIGLNAGLVDVKICAVSEVWSGLKFVYRLRDRTK